MKESSHLTSNDGFIIDEHLPKPGETWRSEYDRIEILNVDDVQVVKFKVIEVLAQPDVGHTGVGMHGDLMAEDLVIDYVRD